MNDRIANTFGPVVEESDESAALFSPSTLFAGYDVTQGGDPGYADVPAASNPVDTEPSWVTAPPRSEPAPIAASTPAPDADSTWRLWPATGPASIAIALPNGKDIRALWVPVIPFAFNISVSIAGAPLYSVSTTGGEVIPIPHGCNLLVLSASPNVLRQDIWVFATGDKLDPNKTAVQGTPLPIAGATSPYDKMILARPALEFYWPLNDAPGTLSAQQIGPTAGSNGTVTGGVQFGSSSLLSDGASSAFFSDGAQTTEIKLGTATPGNNGSAPFSIELWWAYSGFDSGTGSAQDNIIGNDPAGPMLMGLTKSNGELYVSGPGSIALSPQSGRAHYMVLTVDAGSTWTVWLDGAIVSQSGPGAAWANMGATWWVGARGATGTPGIIGNIAKVAFYGRVLTNSEIAQSWSYHY